MSGYRMLKEYREEKASLGRQRFLVLYSSPVLLAPPPSPVAKPTSPGGVGGGFLTREQAARTGPDLTPSKRAPLLINDLSLVIPVVKREGHPFPERIGVGRTKGTDITLMERDVSKYHGYFSVAGDRWSFMDAGSSNGTYVRGERLAQNVAVMLDDGVEIAFGSGRYVFRTAAGFCDYLG